MPTSVEVLSVAFTITGVSSAMAASASFRTSCTESLAASLGVTTAQITSLTITAFRRRLLQGRAGDRRALASGSAEVSSTVAVGTAQTAGVTSSLTTLTTTFASSLASTAGIFVTVSGVSGGLVTPVAPSPAPTVVAPSGGLSSKDKGIIAGSVVGSVVGAWMLLAVFYYVVEPRKFSLFHALAGSKSEEIGGEGVGEVQEGQGVAAEEGGQFELGMGSDDSSSSSGSSSGLDGWDSSSSGSSSGVGAWYDLQAPGLLVAPNWMAEPFTLLAQPLSWMVPAAEPTIGDVETGKRDGLAEEVKEETAEGGGRASQSSGVTEETPPSPEPAKKMKKKKMKTKKVGRRLPLKEAGAASDAPVAPTSPEGALTATTGEAAAAAASLPPPHAKKSWFGRSKGPPLAPPMEVLGPAAAEPQQAQAAMQAEVQAEAAQATEGAAPSADLIRSNEQFMM